MKKKRRVKAGTSKAAAAARKVAFAYAYIVNGQNATEAAKTAGCPSKGAHVAGARLLKDAKVQTIIAEATEKAAKIAGLSVKRTLREIARLAYSDIGKLFDEAGNLIAPHLLDDDARACIASIEVDEIGDGKNVIGHTRKIKQWDKNSALEKAMKYHGLYERDNEQSKLVFALHAPDFDKMLADFDAKYGTHGGKSSGGPTT